MAPATPLVVDTTTLVNFLVGIFLPFLLAYLQSWRATSQFKAAFSFLACLVVSLLVTVLTKATVGYWSADMGENIRLLTFNFVALLLTAWNLFARLYQPLGLIDKLEKTGYEIGEPGPPRR